jgi:dehydrogenase/reductase SDR family member 7B
MTRRFDGKVVWITGASSGIGEALAEAFAKEGAELILSARRESELTRVAENARQFGAKKAHVVPLDLTDPASLESAVEKTKQLVDHLDVMIHNGGISQRAKAIETPLDADRRIMETNFFGTVALTKALLPWMVTKRTGRFVVITSLVGHFGTPLRSTYSASKHALHGFFESLRAEHHDDGLRVTLVAPGFVRTEVSRNAVGKGGVAQGTMDQATDAGMDAAECAARIVDGVAKGRDNFLVGGREVAGVYVKRLSPRLFDRLIRRAKVV